jgi:hypothetical protein
MSNAAADLAAELALLENRVHTERDRAVWQLRQLREQWARALLGVRSDGRLVPRVRAAADRGVDAEVAHAAIAQLAEAERNGAVKCGTGVTDRRRRPGPDAAAAAAARGRAIATTPRHRPSNSQHSYSSHRG